MRNLTDQKSDAGTKKYITNSKETIIATIESSHFGFSVFLIIAIINSIRYVSVVITV